jgi:hypothetical protein
MCLNETCSKVYIGKYLYDALPIQNGLKEGNAVSPFLFSIGLESAVRNV